MSEVPLYVKASGPGLSGLQRRESGDCVRRASRPADLGIVLLKGPKGARFLMSEVPLYLGLAR